MEKADRSARVREALSVIDLFESWGIAVLPGPRGQKGTRTQGWPSLNPDRAAALCRAELRRHAVNIAARTGPTARGDSLAVVNLDGHVGYDPQPELEAVQARLPEGVAIVQTCRGYTVWFRVMRAKGNGLLRGFTSPQVTAELFTGVHLVQLPPSLHPKGVEYSWLLPPGGELPCL